MNQREDMFFAYKKQYIKHAAIVFQTNPLIARNGVCISANIASKRRFFFWRRTPFNPTQGGYIVKNMSDSSIQTEQNGASRQIKQDPERYQTWYLSPPARNFPPEFWRAVIESPLDPQLQAVVMAFQKAHYYEVCQKSQEFLAQAEYDSPWIEFALYLLAEAKLQIEPFDFSDALRTYQTATIQFSESGHMPWVYTRQAQIHVYLGNYETARDLLKQVLFRYPTYQHIAAIHAAFGWCCLRLNDNLSAKLVFRWMLEKISDLDPAYQTYALLQLGEVAFYEGDSPKAIEYYEASDALDRAIFQTHRDALVNWGNALLRQTKYRAALQMFQRLELVSVRQNDDESAFYQDLARIKIARITWELGGHFSAIQKFEHFLEHRQESQVWVMAQQEYDRCFRLYIKEIQAQQDRERLVDIHYKLARTYLQTASRLAFESEIARLYQKLGLLQNSLQAYEDLVFKAHHPQQQFRLKLQIARIHYLQGRYLEASSEFRLLSAEPEAESAPGSMAFFLGQCDYALKNYDEADEHYQKFLSQDPPALLRLFVCFKLGNTRRHLGDYRAAAQYYEAFLEAYTQADSKPEEFKGLSEQATYYRAECAYQSADYQTAASLYQQAVSQAYIKDLSETAIQRMMECLERVPNMASPTIRQPSRPRDDWNDIHLDRPLQPKWRDSNELRR
jgi:tetratricopeptide (TPR) repeat protein